MEAQYLAAIILSPFIVAFLYAGVHEYLRFKAEGRANYGLVYDEDTGTTYVTGIAEEDDGYDLEEFDPSGYTNPEAKAEPEAEKA